MVRMVRLALAPGEARVLMRCCGPAARWCAGPGAQTSCGAGWCLWMSTAPPGLAQQRTKSSPVRRSWTMNSPPGLLAGSPQQGR
ncbi:hypothetical protein HaLaN_29128, partial [Haematococcus lacustris]